MSFAFVLGFLLVCGGAFAQQKSMTRTEGAAQRYMVLREFALSGSKNVRWETKPVEYVDANGKPLDPSKVSGMKAGGCVDMYGKEHKEGEEYQRPNGRFVYQCKNGAEVVTSCVASDRANKAHLPVGKKEEINGLWHNCETYPNGSTIYTQESYCTGQKKDYRVGEEVFVGNLRVQCAPSGFKIVGCFYVDENGQNVALNEGEKRTVGKVEHTCEGKGDQLQYYSKTYGCSKNDKEYKEGDTFKNNHLHYKCENGLVRITGCYTDEGSDIQIGQDVITKNMVHRCYRANGAVEYTEYACGFNGTPSCKPEPLPQTKEDEFGIHDRGFASFAVAQRQDGELKQPASMGLELDKLKGTTFPIIQETRGRRK